MFLLQHWLKVMLHSTLTNIEEGFNGESFLLLNDQTLKEMGIKMSGQILIKKLLNEVRVIVNVAITMPVFIVALPVAI